jgi:hypothetical protein
MVRGLFLGYCMIGFGLALAVFLSLKTKRIACTPRLVWWLCLILGGVTCGYGLSHSTAPSFATRITAVGRTYDCVQRRQGRDTYFGFRFVPDGGQPVDIETEIIIPSWGAPAIFNGRTFRVVYLMDNNRALKNEAIDIQILSGKHAGFHDSLDARPAGKWLGIPLGPALFAFGLLGLRFRRDNAMPTPSDDDTPGYTASLLKS